MEEFPPEECPDMGSLNSLEAIYRELSRIDGTEQKIITSRPKEGENGEEDGENAVAAYTNTESPAGKESEETQQLDRHRQDLRKRAMDLSRDSLKSLSILDLPTDILVQIFGHFQHQQFGRGYNGSIQWPDEPWFYEGTEPLLTIYNARQVCRLFNTVASPLLLPFLNLKLDRKSLDRAEILLANPHIASGVVGVQVSLEYRPDELAQDLAQFAKARKNDLDQWFSAAESGWSQDEYGGYEDINDREGPSYVSMTNKYRAIVDAWDHFLGIKEETPYWDSDEEEDTNGNQADDDGQTNGQVENAVDENSQSTRSTGNRSEYDDTFSSTNRQDDDQDSEGEKYEPDEEAFEYYDILCSSHKEYAKLQKTQHDLLHTRSFVKTLSSLLSSRANRPLALRIHSSFDIHTWPRYNSRDVFTKKAVLAEFLLTTHHLEEMEEMRRSAVTLVQAKILSELPIAMHKAGVALRHLTIGCLPRLSGFSKLCPGEDESPDSPAWGELATACQHLEVFQGGSTSHPVRKRPLDPRDSAYIERYVSSVLSGHQLEHVSLSLSTYGLNNGNGNKTGARPLPRMPGVFEDIHWPRIRLLRFTAQTLRQEELERFCNALGPNLEHIALVSLNLLDGSWARSVDILRDKMANSHRRGTCRVWMSDLRGGETGPKEYYRSFDDLDIALEFQQYVEGKLEENPAVK